MARRQLKTNNVAGGEYTGVGERVMSFREDYPNSKNVTRYEEKENGEVVFKVYLWKDKKETIELLKAAIKANMGKEQAEELILLSADSEASSRGNVKTKKDYEKQETIALGRALAYFGYSGNGQIASTEEMNEFLSYKDDKLEDSIIDAVEYIEESNDMKELQSRFLELPREVKSDVRVQEAKDSMKDKFSKKEAKNDEAKQKD